MQGRRLLAMLGLLVVTFAGGACGKKKSSGSGGDFSLLPLSQAALSLPPAGAQAIPVVIDRSAGYLGDVSVAIASAPAGVTAQPLTIAAGSTASALSLLVGGSAPHGGPFPFEVSASGAGHTHQQAASVYVVQTTFGPDASLGSAGTMITNCGGICRRLDDFAFTPDDGIVATTVALAGTNETFTLAKFDVTGAPDPSFGTAGVKTISIPGVASAEAEHAAVDDQGRIVVGGVDLSSSPHRTIVVRLHPDGSLDTSFASTGYTLNYIASYDADVFDLKLDQEGRIYIAGEGYLSATGAEVGYVARFLPDGELDTAGFGTGGSGKILTVDGTFISQLYIDELFTSGPLFMIGAGPNSWAIWRYDLDGSPHSGFGQTATGFTQSNVQGIGETLVVNDFGNILGAGLYQTGSPYPEAVVAFASADGSIATAFGSSGAATSAYDNSNFSVAQLFYDDGPSPTVLWVVGTVTDGSSQRSAAISMRSGDDGSLDTTFGSNGFYVTRVDGTSTYVAAARRDAHGRIVLLEDWTTGSGYTGAIQRFFAP